LAWNWSLWSISSFIFLTWSRVSMIALDLTII
jgi:hypothetical protein